MTDGGPERTRFRLELFSRGGDPKAPVGRVFELPCPGLPADARFFGVIQADRPETALTVQNLAKNALLSAETLEKRTLQTGLEGRFEAMLLAMNRGYAELAANGSVPTAPLPDALLGLVVGTDLFVTGRGGVEAILLRPSEPAPRNLFSDGETRRESRVLFRTIVSGTLRAGDVLLVTISSLFDYLALPHLTRLLASMPAATARTRLLELLGDVSPSVCLSGIIVGEPQQATATAPRALAALKSIHPGLSPAPTAAWPKGRAPSPFPAYAKTAGGAAAVGAKAAGRGVAIGAKALGRGSKAAWRVATDAASRRRLRHDAKARAEAGVSRWNALPRRSKILVIVGLALLLLFGEGIRFMARNRAADDRVRAYNEAVAAVQTKRDAADAAMIYKDEDRAWSALAEAQAAVEALPQRTETEKKTAAELLGQIEADREKLRHVVRLDSLAPLATLPAEAGAGVTVLAGKKLDTIVTDRGGAWNWDLEKRTLTAAVPPFLEAGVVLRAYPGASSPLFVTEKSVVERVATSTAKAPITLPGGAKASATAMWSGRLYGLVPAANQVFRGSKGANGWNLSAAALKNPSVTDAADLAIDGEVWTVSPTRVRKWLQGNEQTMELKRTDPSPTSLSRIWLAQDGELLAVRDAASKRLYLFGKDGSFKMQFAGGPADDLRDLVISAKDKTLTMLTATALFIVPIAQ